MKVIQYVDPTGQTMVARVPKQGTAAFKFSGRSSDFALFEQKRLLENSQNYGQVRWASCYPVVSYQ